jgi:hypothetical protein
VSKVTVALVCAMIAFTGAPGCSTTACQSSAARVVGMFSAGPPAGATWDEPPPDITPILAKPPMMAMRRAVFSRGSTPLFFSNTVPLAACARAAASPAATLGGATFGGSSNRCVASMERRMREFMSVMRVV